MLQCVSDVLSAENILTADGSRWGTLAQAATSKIIVHFRNHCASVCLFLHKTEAASHRNARLAFQSIFAARRNSLKLKFMRPSQYFETTFVELPQSNLVPMWMLSDRLICKPETSLCQALLPLPCLYFRRGRCFATALVKILGNSRSLSKKGFELQICNKSSCRHRAGRSIVADTLTSLNAQTQAISYRKDG